MTVMMTTRITGKPSAHSSLWHAIWLIIHLIAVIAVTKMNASSLETLLDSMNAPVAFTGFLVALLILSPEGLGALKAVLNNQVQARDESVLWFSVSNHFAYRTCRHANCLYDG
ncbi:calcium/sodium:proton antiporter [Escherichia coli]|nr:calcium/sodium:proton antiporter [Escherichia coli]